MVSEALKNITINGKTYILSATTGTVAECQKRNETIVSGRGGGGFVRDGSGYINSVSVNSRTKVHDQIFLIDELGQEHSFQFQNYDLVCRTSNKLSIIEVHNSQDSTGINIAVYNHSTQQISWNMFSLSNLHKPKSLLNSWIFLIVIIFASITKLWIL